MEDMKMGPKLGCEEFRWQIVKAMLDEYPGLKEKVRSYVEVKVG
jgi:hypothetical protein